MNDFIERLEGFVTTDTVFRVAYVKLRDNSSGEVYTFRYSTYDVAKVAPALWQRWLIEKAKCTLAEMWKEQPDVL